MQSLRTMLPEICDILGITLAHAYERQRVLVKAGVLRARPGRGPGSGVPGTAQNLVTLLIALLLGDLREHPISTVKAITSAKPVHRCAFHGEARFGEVMTAILEADPLALGIARNPTAIWIERDSVEAVIQYERIDKSKSTFGDRYRVIYRTQQSAQRARLHVQAMLDREALPMIRRVLANANDGEAT